MPIPKDKRLKAGDSRNGPERFGRTVKAKRLVVFYKFWGRESGKFFCLKTAIYAIY